MTFDKIPEELRKLDRWVCWRIEDRGGKPTKVPINPLTGGRAMSNNPATWGTFYDAIERQDVKGIGFMFNGDGIVGVDLDNCIDPEKGMEDFAKDIINTLDSYTETSQSGKGIHILCYGKLPDGKRRKGAVEMYESGRFFIMTGNTVDDAHTDIEDRTEELAAVHKKYLSDTKKAKIVNNSVETVLNLDENEIIQKAMNAKNGSLFSQLFSGNWKGIYGSQSEADMAFCNMLAFWCGRDYTMMDRVFRKSGMHRNKWDEKRGQCTYGEKTLNEAINGCSEVYSPQRQKLTSSAQVQHAPEIDLGYDSLFKSEPKELPEWITGPYNDMWNAERLVEQYGEILRYNTNVGWYIWNDKYWEEDKKDSIRIIADKAILALYDYKNIMMNKYGFESKKYKSYVEWICKSRNTGRKDNMIKESRHMENISTLPEAFDRDVFTLNCLNGTLNLNTGKLNPHNRDDLITKIINVNYDPAAKAPTWDKFLYKIFEGKQELIAFIKRAIGYSLTGSIKEQCIFILHGVGKNGKSTFLDTVRSMIGEYTKNANVSVFLKTDKQNFEEIARLQSARFVTTTEPEEGEFLSESFIKQATGGEPLTARYLYKGSFEFIPEFKIWMGTNHKPKIKGSDLGIWRRIMLIPFSYIVPESERDPDLTNKLKRELPGILNWAIEGCMEWQKSGLNAPKEVLQATDDYRGEMDLIQLFLDECTEKKDSAIMKSGDIYRVYEAWCTQNGEYKMSNTKFALKLKERGIKKGRTSTMRTWEGIDLSKRGRAILYGGNFEKDTYVQNELPIPEIPWNNYK